MEPISALDIGTVIVLIGFVYKQSADKAALAREAGEMRQQIRSLEARATQWDQRFSELDGKIERLLAGVTRLETLLATRAINLETPEPVRLRR